MAEIEEARRTFEKFDENGDGFITPTEFQRAMIELGDRHYTVGLAEAVVKSRDANGDGKLTFEEFYQQAQKI